jgi:hypothetical protein
MDGDHLCERSGEQLDIIRSQRERFSWYRSDMENVGVFHGRHVLRTVIGPIHLLAPSILPTKFSVCHRSDDQEIFSTALVSSDGSYRQEPPGHENLKVSYSINLVSIFHEYRQSIFPPLTDWSTSRVRGNKKPSSDHVTNSKRLV